MRNKLGRVPKAQRQENLSQNGVVTAAEMYEVQSSYVRYDQTNNMGSQVYWVPGGLEARAGLKTK